MTAQAEEVPVVHLRQIIAAIAALRKARARLTGPEDDLTSVVDCVLGDVDTALGELYRALAQVFHG